MQYFKPPLPHLFAGDCMPFSYAGQFFLYYLLDEGHHQGLRGLGGHQWALATSHDLVEWTHHPLALPITADWEGSICTGSVLHHAGRFYAFYATRRRDFTQHLSLAVSRDGLSYEKLDPNPLFLPPPGYNPYHFRDPFAFHTPDGHIHLIVSAFQESHPLPQRGGCLAHLSAAEPNGPWKLHEPFFIPGTPDVPECADLFEWQGRFYLIYSSGLQAHYRVSPSLFGPWERPVPDTFEPPAARVMKTAAWDDRRIGAAWVGSRKENRDNEEMVWGGQIVLRELLPQQDGRLFVRPLDEARPQAVPFTGFAIQPITPAAKVNTAVYGLTRSGGLEALCIGPLPCDLRMRLGLVLGEGAGPLGLKLRAGDFESGYTLELDPAAGQARLFDQAFSVWNPGQLIDLDVTLCGSLLDVCIDGRHSLITRGGEYTGPNVWLYALDRELRVENLHVDAITAGGIG
jgi:hypothetical protein